MTITIAPFVVVLLILGFILSLLYLYASTQLIKCQREEIRILHKLDTLSKEQIAAQKEIIKAQDSLISH